VGYRGARPLSSFPDHKIVILSEGAAESKDLRLPLSLPVLSFVISQLLFVCHFAAQRRNLLFNPHGQKEATKCSSAS
jgi:hypothetical protein